MFWKYEQKCAVKRITLLLLGKFRPGKDVTNINICISLNQIQD